MGLVADHIDGASLIFLIIAVDEPQGIHTPEIPVLVFVFQGEVEAIGIAVFNHEVLFDEVVLSSILRIVLIHLVTVEVGKLGELFPVTFNVQGHVIGEVDLGAKHIMVGFLQLGGDFVSVEIVGEVVDTRQEAIEEVDHVAVASGGHEVLRIASRCTFET